MLLERPGDAAHRQRIASIEHKQGFGVQASVSPDGRLIAYTVLPRDGGYRDTDAQLWLLPLDTRKPRRLAVNVDVLSDLVWTPDSAWVGYERVPAAGSAVLEVRRVNVQGAGDQLLASDSQSTRWYVLGYTPDSGTIAFARLDGSGTAVGMAKPGTLPSQFLATLPGSSRDFTISRTGCSALLALSQENGRAVYRAYGCADGGMTRLAHGGVEDTGIAWNPATGAATVGVVRGPAGTAVPGGEGANQVRVPPSGFDVPLSWSGDGRWLAVEHFSGASTDDPGNASIEAVSANGAATPITGDGPLTVAGWTAAA